MNDFYKKKFVIFNDKTKIINQIAGGKKEIYFIRHAETNWNVEGRAQGQEADIPLNSNGILQATITGKYLNDYRQINKPFDCVISSPMNRAYKTAKIIGTKIGIEKKSIIKLNELTENKAGILSGQTENDKIKKEFLEKISDVMNNIKDPVEIYELEEYIKAENLFLPEIGDYGLESNKELTNRINKVITYIKQTTCNKIIIVSHSGFLSDLLKTIFSINKLPKGDMSKTKNCWICYCTYNNDKFHMISPMNTEHLKLYE